MTEIDKEGHVEFRWGKKRGIGGKKKDVQFYESFTYDGVEYTLFDSVYLYKEDETEPYIGKLIKIWENPDKSRKVKVLWFFRACEILHFLGVDERRDNELFLACGEGLGLANVNPLEAIAGKCNVICISKDSRNQQPSYEELQIAEFVFSRFFDVGQRRILDEIDDKIAGTEVKFLFNELASQTTAGVVSLGLEKKEVSEKATTSNEAVAPSSIKSKECVIEKVVDTLVRENIDSKSPLVKQSSSVGEKPTFGANSKFYREESGRKAGGDSIPQVEIEGAIKSTRGNGEVSESKQQKEAKLVGSSKISNEKNKSNMQNRRLVCNDDDDDVVVVSPREKGAKRVKVSCNDDDDDDNNGLNTLARDVVSPKEKGAKRVKVSCNDHDDDDNGLNTLARDVVSPKEKGVKRMKVSCNAEEVPSKKLKPNKEPTKLTNSKLHKESSIDFRNVEDKLDSCATEVTRRPGVDRSRWFKGFPWEERLKTAHDQGTLVLLQNLDPSLTSQEVEDIVWHGFNKKCVAKMMQTTTFSSPHSGQAFVVFKTREVAEMVVKKLDEGCLLLSNGRPLVGSIKQPCFPEKKPIFYGHHVIDQLRIQMNRDMKDAVSTSHCSQPNNVEYDMAMEWCLLQERADSAAKKLFQKQSEELRRLKAKLKSK